MYAQTLNLRRNLAAMFLAVLFSAVTVLAAVGPGQLSTSAIAAVA